MDIETNQVVIGGEYRYVIIEKNTGKLLDDAQGYGYKTAQGAHKAGWYKYQNGKKKIDSEKSIAKQFWKLHRDIKNDVIDMLEGNIKEICRGEITETQIITDFEKQYGFVIPKSALKYLEA